MSILCSVFKIGPQAGNKLIYGMENVTVLFLAEIRLVIKVSDQLFELTIFLFVIVAVSFSIRVEHWSEDCQRKMAGKLL